MKLYNITINNTIKTVHANTYSFKTYKEAYIFAYGMVKGMQSSGVEVKGWAVKEIKNS